jgi:hypothetical protein
MKTDAPRISGRTIAGCGLAIPGIAILEIAGRTSDG